MKFPNEVCKAGYFKIVIPLIGTIAILFGLMYLALGVNVDIDIDVGIEIASLLIECNYVIKLLPQ